MPGRFSDHRVELWLNELSTIWLAAHYDNPDVAGAYASEVFGGSYARVMCPLTQSSNRVVYNLNPVTILGLPAVTVTHIAGWDTQINGNMEFSIPLPSPVRVLAGKSLPIPASAIALSFG